MLNKSGARMQNEGLGRDAIAIFIMVFPITLPEPIGGGVFFYFLFFLFFFVSGLFFYSGGRARRLLWSEIK